MFWIVKKKYYFDIFQHEKYFEKQPQSYFQTGSLISIGAT
jgi:hypothetical protein